MTERFSRAKHLAAVSLLSLSLNIGCELSAKPTYISSSGIPNQAGRLVAEGELELNAYCGSFEANKNLFYHYPQLIEPRPGRRSIHSPLIDDAGLAQVIGPESEETLSIEVSLAEPGVHQIVGLLENQDGTQILQRIEATYIC